MPNNFHGQQRETVLRRLVDDWLPGGRPVAILQGFPGCGKSQLAAAVLAQAKQGLEPIVLQQDWTDPVLDLFIELESALAAKGILGLREVFEKDAPADHQKALMNLGKALLEILRREEILVVLDEFQRLLPKDKTTPPLPWATLIEDFNNSSNPRGRLLLVSNRLIKEDERWSENCKIEELSGLTDTEAESLFTELLESKGLGFKVPPEQRRAIVHRLSGNPRALKSLVIALRTESLNDLIPNAPDLKNTGDAVMEPRLLEAFERELMERALPKLEVNLLKFMRWLSVHRRPFQKEALAQFTGGLETPEALREQLIDRFLLESGVGGDTPHQLAREISVNRIRSDKGEWVQAHNLAANYHMRRFEARQLGRASTLPASYVELRHHLFEAGRIDEIHKVSERLTKYALSQIGLETSVPKIKELLEERIALLSTIPDDERPRILEYHLARCLVNRNESGDKERALKHARRGTGRHQVSYPWLLRLNLEFEFHGIDIALPVVNESLRNINDAAPIYQRWAELLASAGRVPDALQFLEKGFKAVPANKNLYFLYQTAVELAGRSGDLRNAEELTAKGLEAIPKGVFGRHRIAETALRIRAEHRDIEAIRRLSALSGQQQMDRQQLLLAECLVARVSGEWETAIEISRKCRSEFPSYVPFRTSEVDALLGAGQLKEADDLMKDYEVNQTQLVDNPMVWLKAYVALIVGRLDEARTIATMYAPMHIDPSRPLNEAEMLRLWAAARDGTNGVWKIISLALLNTAEE